jgi:CRP/FNR family transcriptional regulator
MLAVKQPMFDVSLNARTPVQIIQKKLKQSCPQLVGSDNASWERLLQTAEIVELPADMLVMQPNSPCAQFMLIIEGCVRVYQQNPDDREITLYRSHCGDLCVLSVNGMLQRRAFGAFAKTETKVLALSLSREQFLKAMTTLPVFCEFVLTSLTNRINDVLQIIENTVFESLDTRLMCFLSRMSRETGSDTLHLTHQELARELGTSREVISRILKAFERQGCIALERGVIHITL